MPLPGCSARWSASQASRCSAVVSRTTPSRSVSRSRLPRRTSASPPELLRDVVGDALVGGRRGRQHRDAVGQLGEQGADPAVVGPEVVAPVGDAVRLVDHEQAAGRGQPRQHLVAEAGVVEPLRAHQEHVDLAALDRRVGLLPLLDVGRVDRDRADAGALGGRDLVAHQREQRRDDHRRPAALLTQQQRGDEVDRRLAPPGALHDQRPPPVDHQRLDRRPLVVVELRVGCPSLGPTSARRCCSARARVLSSSVAAVMRRVYQRPPTMLDRSVARCPTVQARGLVQSVKTSTGLRKTSTHPGTGELTSTSPPQTTRDVCGGIDSWPRPRRPNPPSRNVGSSTQIGQK